MPDSKEMEWQNICLSEHFSLFELCRSREHPDLVEAPDPLIIYWLNWWARKVLEPLREVTGPIGINSGFRNPRLNKAVNGEKNSIHQISVGDRIVGVASDIVTPQTPFDETFRIIFRMAHLSIRGAIIYPFRHFIHIDSREGPRRFFECVRPKVYRPLSEGEMANYRLPKGARK